MKWRLPYESCTRTSLEDMSYAVAGDDDDVDADHHIFISKKKSVAVSLQDFKHHKIL